MKINRNSDTPKKGEKTKSSAKKTTVTESSITVGSRMMTTGKFKALAGSILKPKAVTSVSRSDAMAAVKSVLSKEIKGDQRNYSANSVLTSPYKKKK